MSDENADVKLQLKVMVNKERKKVLYAVADNHFADILLSFLTLPLGRIVRVLEKQFGDKAPKIGSLCSLYQSLADLDTSRFVTEGAKEMLLNPRSSFEAEYLSLKLDIADNRRDDHSKCELAGCEVIASSDGVFTSHQASFTISDDLQIIPNETGLIRMITILGITDAHNAEEIQVEFGFDEFMKLLKASLASQTPLSDVILPRKTRPAMYPCVMEPQPEIEETEQVCVKKLGLTVVMVIQESAGKLLYAQAKEDFIDFLFSLLHIPLGGVEHLLGGKNCFKAIDNLYRTTADLKREYFKYPLYTRERLLNPTLPFGCVSKTHILRLARGSCPSKCKIWQFSSSMFPRGWGTYLLGPKSYKVTDDLTITPFCAVSTLATLNNLKIPVSDVKEVELQIGLKEGLSILQASLTSTSVLTDALLKHITNKRVKEEV